MIRRRSSVSRSSIKAKAAAATASAAIKSVWKRARPKLKRSTRMTVKQSTSVHPIWWLDMSAVRFYCSCSFPCVHQIRPALCQRPKAPASLWFRSITTTMKRRCASCSCTEAAVETPTGLILERNVRLCVVVSSTLISPFTQDRFPKNQEKRYCCHCCGILRYES